MRDDLQSWRKSDFYQVASEEGVAPSGAVDLENRNVFKAFTNTHKVFLGRPFKVLISFL